MSKKPTGSLAMVQHRIDAADGELESLGTAYLPSEELKVIYRGLKNVMQAIELLTEAVQDLKESREIEAKLMRMKQERKEEQATERLKQDLRQGFGASG